MLTKLFSTDILPLSLGERKPRVEEYSVTPYSLKAIPGKPYLFITGEGKMLYLPPEPKEETITTEPIISHNGLVKQNPTIPLSAFPAPEGATHWDSYKRMWRKPGFFCHNPKIQVWRIGVFDTELLADYPARFFPLESKE